MTNRNMTAVEYLMNHFRMFHIWHDGEPDEMLEAFQQAKQMENEQNDKWNEFLDAEKVLGISDVKTIERIQWYYNTYFNETYGKDSNESNA